jgi:hypothetical protein
METFAELTQRLLAIQSGGRPTKSAITKLDDLPTRKPVPTVELSQDNPARPRLKD